MRSPKGVYEFPTHREITSTSLSRQVAMQRRPTYRQCLSDRAQGVLARGVHLVRYLELLRRHHRWPPALPAPSPSCCESSSRALPDQFPLELSKRSEDV